MTSRQQQDARHQQAVRTYYDTQQEALLSPVLADLRPRLAAFLEGKGMRDTQLLEDLVQESLLGTLTGLRAQQYTFAGTVAAWAVSICWHQLASRKRRKQDGITQPGAAEDPFLLLATTLATPAEELPLSQEATARAGAVVEAVTHAVLNLDPSARSCVLLHYYQGLPEATAAARLGIAESQFKTRLRRGLTSLREWSTRNHHLAPAAEVYAALTRVNSGDLFREPSLLAC